MNLRGKKMSKYHNKKRNTALLYEFLVRTISAALVEGDKKKSSTALRILKKYYKPGTQLYKEFRLFNALLKTTVSSDSVSSTIINEARAAASSANLAELDREKSLLIRSINHMIKDDNFYDQPISEYKMYASIQTLLNEWRKTPGSADIAALGKYEDQLRIWLLSEKKSADFSVNDDSPGTSRLLMKVMMKKLNEKYSTSLNSDQKEIIRSYAFSAANDDQTTIKKKLEEIRKDLLNAMDVYSAANPENAYVIQKLNVAKVQMLSESLDAIDDASVSRFMLYSSLKQELSGDEGDKQ
jgi:hypothetical protein